MAVTASRPAAVPDAGYVILIAAAAAMGGFLFGFDTAVINGAVLALKEEFNASRLGIGLAVSLTLLARRSAPSAPGRSPTGSAASAA